MTPPTHMYRKPYTILTVQNWLVSSACWVTEYNLWQPLLASVFCQWAWPILMDGEVS